MSRILIVKWEDLQEGFSGDETLSIFVRDKKTGQMKLLNVRAFDVSFEGESDYEEFRASWNPTLFDQSDENI